MIEIFSHLFVWIVSPAAVFGTAMYAVLRKELFLSTFASASVLLACAAVAMWMFEGHLMSYQLIYSALTVIPGLLLVATAVSAAIRFTKLLLRKFQPTSAATHVL